MEKTYKAKPGARFSNSQAEKIGQELEKLAVPGILLKPRDIWTKAKSSKHPLHNYFEWNDGKAADQFRDSQARHLVNHLEVVYIEQDKKGESKILEIKAYHHVENEGDEGYVSFIDVTNNPEYHRQILEKAMSEARNWRIRYKEYNELKAIVKAIEKAEGKLRTVE